MGNRTELWLKTMNYPLPAGAKVEGEYKWETTGHFQNRIYQAISRDLVAELIDRGFDPKTLKIEVQINPKELESRFPHIYNSLTEKEKERLRSLY